MKRTLKDTNRTVQIIIDNRDRQQVWDDGTLNIWTATATIDGEGWYSSENGPTPDKAFALLATELDKSGDLNDLPIPVPEQDKELLLTLMRAIIQTWETAAEIPDWRTNEYIRGQLELILETCRVVADDEEDVDGEVLRDRIITWLEAGVWR